MRWMARNPFGQKLAPVLDKLSASGDGAVVFRLKKPFLLLFHALAGLSQSAFIMLERVTKTDPFEQLEDATGSKPFRFKRDEFNSGGLVVYERNAAYRPGGEAASLTGGASWCTSSGWSGGSGAADVALRGDAAGCGRGGGFRADGGILGAYGAAAEPGGPGAGVCDFLEDTGRVIKARASGAALKYAGIAGLAWIVLNGSQLAKGSSG